MKIEELAGTYAEARKAAALGNLLAKARIRKDWRLNDVIKAVPARMSASAISHAESGRQTLSLDSLRLVANALDENAEALVRDAGFEVKQYRSKHYDVGELGGGDPAVQFSLLADFIESRLGESRFDDPAEAAVTVSGIVTLAAMPVLYGVLINDSDGPEVEQAANMLLWLLNENSLITETMIAATCAADAIRSQMPEDGMDYDEAILIPGSSTGLYEVLKIHLLLNPSDAKPMLEVGLQWGIAGFFAFPIGLAAAEHASIGRRIMRSLSRWAKETDDSQVHSIVALAKKTAKAFKNL